MGSPRSRATSAISASATAQRARAMVSCGPKARAARRKRAFARVKSPSWAIVAQGDPLQRAERVTGRESARRGGDQGVHFSEPNSIAPHLSLPPFNGPVAVYLTLINQVAADNRRRQHVNARRNEMEKIAVWGFSWVPPFAQGLVRDLRVRWALEEAGLAYESRWIGIEERNSDAYRRKHPFGMVPVLESRDGTLIESGAI